MILKLQRFLWRLSVQTPNLKFKPIARVSLFSSASFRMILNIYTVDAFSEKPFEGNPAAVVPLNEALEENVMQKIAFEMNLSETAFVIPLQKASSLTDSTKFALRWFTPVKEVPLCGHATLATAHTLFNVLGNSSSSLEFETLSGVLVARKQDGGIILDFPLNMPSPLSEEQLKRHSPLVTAIIKDKQVKDVLFSATTGKMLIRLADTYSRSDLEQLNPSSVDLLRTNNGTEVRGVIVTLLGDLHLKDSGRGVQNHHFVSRYFAPWVGISEDPVTGSAHTVLGPYWSDELKIKELKCRQCSPRGGELTLKVRDDNRVDIFGKATTVLQGKIAI